MLATTRYCTSLKIIGSIIFISALLVFKQADSSELPTSIVIVGSGDSNSITSFKLTGIGKQAELNHIHELAFEQASTPSVSTPMAISKDKERVYIASRNKKPRLYQYGLNLKSAELELKSLQAIDHSYAYLKLSPNNEVLFGASYPQHLISHYALNQRGKVVHQQSLDGIRNAHGILHW